MQMKKAGAVAVGALATVAVMGAPASASSHTAVDAKTSMMRELGGSFLGNGIARDGWGAPWGGVQQSLVSAGTGSVVNAAAWQVCGSDAVAGVGGTINAGSTDTMMDGCTNANIWLKQDTVPPVIGALNDTAIAAASWQACGANVMGGVGGTIALQTAHTVLGGCDNSNIVITGHNGYTEAAKVKMTPQQKSALKAAKMAAKKQRLASKLAGVGGNGVDVVRAAFVARKNDMVQQHAGVAAAPKGGMGDWGAPWNLTPQSLVTVGDGSAVQAASWQVCGGTAVWGVGGVISSGTPNTVFGDCRNATVHITQNDPTSVVSALDNTSINAAPWQVCGSNTVAGVGGNISLQSPNTVFGGCHNADTIID